MTDQAAVLRVAVIDLYNGEENQGMRCIREFLEASDRRWHGIRVEHDVFDTRLGKEIPGPDFDAYISTGGPGSPFDGRGESWEQLYFNWLRSVWRHNQANEAGRKHAIFICHSFQMMCRYFHLGDVGRRRTESFGIFPVHKTAAGADELLFAGLDNPFYAADFRNWQVIQPDHGRLRELGATTLALEKIRPHVELERAVMAIRVSPEIVGVQFHPEADSEGMLMHFSKPRRRKSIIDRFGEEKYQRIIHRLKDPDFLARTHGAVLPAFLQAAVEAKVADEAMTAR